MYDFIIVCPLDYRSRPKQKRGNFGSGFGSKLNLVRAYEATMQTTLVLKSIHCKSESAKAVFRKDPPTVEKRLSPLNSMGALV